MNKKAHGYNHKHWDKDVVHLNPLRGGPRVKDLHFQDMPLQKAGSSMPCYDLWGFPAGQAGQKAWRQR